MSGVGFLEEDQLETYGGNYNTTTQPGASAAPNAANELPKEDLSKYAQLPNCQKIVDELRKIAPWNIGKKTAKKLELDECYNREKLVKVLNEKLENAGHHMIYDYATATVAAPYPAIVTKRILHSNAVAGFSSLSGVELKNMEMWLRNGIMRNNALKGASPLQPESTINVFRDYYKTQKGIGDPITATIALITAITAAITAAAGAAIAIIQQLRAAEVAKLGRDITNPNFSMEGEDFLTGGSGSGGSSNSWLLPVGAGVATLLLLSNNK